MDISISVIPSDLEYRNIGILEKWVFPFPLLHYSIIPLFHYSIIPSLHYFPLLIVGHLTVTVEDSQRRLGHLTEIGILEYWKDGYCPFPLFHYSIIPLLHYSIIPLLHYSITPLFHYSITPILFTLFVH